MKCNVCGNKATKRCGKCLINYYCSSECQEKDWIVGHKILCCKFDIGKQNGKNVTFENDFIFLFIPNAEIKNGVVIIEGMLSKFYFEGRKQIPSCIQGVSHYKSGKTAPRICQSPKINGNGNFLAMMFGMTFLFSNNDEELDYITLEHCEQSIKSPKKVILKFKASTKK